MPALAVRGIRKAYGGTLALDDVALSVAQGEIRGLLGENGAGKSTLVRIVAGIEPPDSGEVTLFGRSFSDGLTADEAARAGVAVIHQNLGLIPTMSVADNVGLVAGYARRHGLISWRASRAAAHAALEVLRLGDLDVTVLVESLPLATQALVAIARALATRARLIILDEPTAALQASEAQLLFRLMGHLRSSGAACVLISHRMDEVIAVCDSVTVLRNGRPVASSPIADVTKADLVELITGRAPSLAERSPEPVATSRGLAIDALAAPGLGPVSVDVDAGEVVAITGLSDSGHLRLADMLAGIERPHAGCVTLLGRPYRPHSFREALALGLAFVPAERNRYGLIPAMTVRENLFLNVPGRSWRPIVPARERRRARELALSFDIRPPDPERAVSTLSGGNQQKVLLAKWLHAHPRLLVLCEPGAAVDVGAKTDIHARVRRFGRQARIPVVIVTSDFQEACDACDRVVVMRRGRVGRVIAGEQLSVEAVTGAAYEGTAHDGVAGPGAAGGDVADHGAPRR